MPFKAPSIALAACCDSRNCSLLEAKDIANDLLMCAMILQSLGTIVIVDHEVAANVGRVHSDRFYLSLNK